MTLQPYIKLNTKEVKNIIAGCLKMAKQPEFDFTIESIIPSAEGNGEWTLSFMVRPVETPKPEPAPPFPEENLADKIDESAKSN